MALPYPLFPHHATHPDHLLALGRWLGLMAPDPSRSLRVLELGCAAGGNVLPMAVRQPHWEVVGIDLAAHEIERGRRLAAAAGASNLSLHVGDVGALGELGRFDVIMAHGLLSWVQVSVAEAMLAWMGAALAPDGVAYLSYNVQAGWAARGELRRWLLAQVQGGSEEERVAQARALLAEPPPDLAEIAVTVEGESDAYLSQDYLATFNEAFRYDALAERLSRHGLAPRCDANGASPEVGGPWLPDRRAAQAAVGDDPVAQGAWLDLQQGRAFRSTVVTRAGALAWRGPVGLWLTTELRRVDGAPLDQPGPTSFASAWGVRTTIADPAVKRLLGTLADAWPVAVSFEAVGAELGDHAVPILSVLVGSNLVHPRCRPGVAPQPGERPEVPADVRVLAAEGAAWAADQHHRGRRLDEADHTRLPLLDGRRDEAALREALGWSAERLRRELASAWERGLRLA